MSIERSTKRNKLQHIQRQQKTFPFNPQFIPRKKITFSVCQTRSQQKIDQKNQQNKSKKKCPTQSNITIIHSLFPKLREEGSNFIDTIKQLKQRKHSNLLIGDTHQSTILKQYRQCKQLMPCATKITKVQQCQFQVKKYLQQINKQRRSSQNIHNMTYLHDKILPKLSKRQQYSVVQISPCPRQTNYGPLCKKSTTKSRSQLKQPIQQHDTLVGKALPFSTIRQTKAIEQVKQRLKHLSRMQKQTSKKKSKLKKWHPSCLINKGDSITDKSISPWQSRYQGFMDILP